MIRTEKAKTYKEAEIGSFKTFSRSGPVRSYKHRQKSGVKGKGAKAVRIEAKIENQYTEIEKQIKRSERATAQRDARRAKRKK
jgi:hypothetical protein